MMFIHPTMVSWVLIHRLVTPGTTSPVRLLFLCPTIYGFLPVFLARKVPKGSTYTGFSSTALKGGKDTLPRHYSTTLRVFVFSWSCFLKNRGPPFPPHHWLPRNYRLSGRRAYRYNLTLSSPAPAQHPFQSPFCPGEAIFSASYGSLERSWRSSSAFSSVASWLASGHSVRVPFRSGWGCGDRGGMWWLGLVSWYALDSKNCYESWRHGSWKMYPLVI